MRRLLPAFGAGTPPGQRRVPIARDAARWKAAATAANIKLE